jgi:ribulose-phosphate 3-epimerase
VLNFDGFSGGKMSKLIAVIPAILTNDAEAFSKMVREAISYSKYVQVDIMDGQFVPSKSITQEQIRGLPAGLKWEVHLMVLHPETQLDGYHKAGAVKVIFHFEATPDPLRVITAARKLGMEVGLAVNPETPVASILPLTEKVDSVLFLAVHPGFYGAKFIPEVLDKIRELRRAMPHLIIGIDGGVKENNIKQIANTGVNEIFVGSAILMQPDPGAAYRKLLLLAREI